MSAFNCKVKWTGTDKIDSVASNRIKNFNASLTPGTMVSVKHKTQTFEATLIEMEQATEQDDQTPLINFKRLLPNHSDDVSNTDTGERTYTNLNNPVDIYEPYNFALNAHESEYKKQLQENSSAMETLVQTVNSLASKNENLTTLCKRLVDDKNSMLQSMMAINSRLVKTEEQNQRLLNLVSSTNSAAQEMATSIKQIHEVLFNRAKVFNDQRHSCANSISDSHNTSVLNNSTIFNNSETAINENGDDDVKINGDNEAVDEQANYSPPNKRSKTGGIFTVCPNDPSKMLVGDNSDLILPIYDYINICQTKKHSTFIVRLVKACIDKSVLAKSSWKGTKNKNGPGKLAINKEPTMQSILHQASRQYSDFKITESIKRAVTNCCLEAVVKANVNV